jgi:predicted 3-demethylubiquinone-9 3-methyltransferase (glyoxalase superfamily)
MQKISPFLWFDHQAEEAINFYVSVFPDSRLGSVQRYDEASAAQSGREPGSIMTMSCVLAGQDFTALNGGPMFTMTPAISFFVSCRTAEEVDALYARLAEGGEVLMPLEKYDFSERYAWVNDRFGVSWQLFVGDHAQSIRPCLMFTRDVAGRAEEAMQHYTALFPDSGIDFAARYPAGMPKDKEGTIMHAAFHLAGQSFVAMDSAAEHAFGFSVGTSLVVQCDDQEEIDRLWSALSAVPEAEQCGWLKDAFGVSWQIVPRDLATLMTPASVGRLIVLLMTPASVPIMMGMKKLDIAALRAASSQ